MRSRGCAAATLKPRQPQDLTVTCRNAVVARRASNWQLHGRPPATILSQVAATARDAAQLRHPTNKELFSVGNANFPPKSQATAIFRFNIIHIVAPSLCRFQSLLYSRHPREGYTRRLVTGGQNSLPASCSSPRGTRHCATGGWHVAEARIRPPRSSFDHPPVLCFFPPSSPPPLTGIVR